MNRPTRNTARRIAFGTLALASSLGAAWRTPIDPYDPDVRQKTLHHDVLQALSTWCR